MVTGNNARSAKTSRTRSPLGKRHLRELKGDFGKYLVIFLLLVLSISEVSGFLVADNSMIAAYEESFDKYHVEDGDFTVERPLTLGQKERIEQLGVTLYELFSVDVAARFLKSEGGAGQTEASEGSEEGDVTIRVFRTRDEVNLACLMSGRLPEAEDEIALDRMFADNNKVAPGDRVRTADGDREWTVSGLVALSDYSTMFESNSDSMFDSLQFGVAVVSDEGFEKFYQSSLTSRYAWKYTDELLRQYGVDPDEIGEGTSELEFGRGGQIEESLEKKISDDFLKGLVREVKLREYIPRYLNQAIQFTGEDMGSDKAAMEVFLYIIIAILAFVFAVTTAGTIQKEANVIGTLRATGYTRHELIRHYMALPILVSLIAALIGNILGYTVMKDVNAGLYYNSYSLPTYETLWNQQAFIRTTLIPIVLILVINYLILRNKLSLSPLQFLRRDLRRGKRGGALPLPRHIPFFTRFRIRVILQNLPGYLVLLVGILFANVLLMFGLLFPALIHHYQETVGEGLLANYQYILQLPSGAVDEDHKVRSMLELVRFMKAVETDTPGAEKFSAYSLRTIPNGSYGGEEVLLYGIAQDSKYIRAELSDEGAVLSSAYADKLHLGAGDEIVLKESYEDKEYRFTVTGVLPYDAALCVFLPQDVLNETFELGDDTFTGYFSNEPITDIDERYVGQVIDLDAVTKISRQLDKSMGEMMSVVDLFAVILFLVLMYLLTKTIIEKNAQAISMAKILGYRNGEIARLYLIPTAVMVIVFEVLSLQLVTAVIRLLFEMIIMSEMTGWIPFWIGNNIYGTMLAMGIGSYLVVMAAEYLRIRRVPMDEALKNQE